MARRKTRRSYSGKITGMGGMFGGEIGKGLSGMGMAAVLKRFVGAPLGKFTGAAGGYLAGGIPGAVGGYVHDNVGNVGGGTSSTTTTTYL